MPEIILARYCVLRVRIAFSPLRAFCTVWRVHCKLRAYVVYMRHRLGLQVPAAGHPFGHAVLTQHFEYWML